MNAFDVHLLEVCKPLKLSFVETKSMFVFQILDGLLSKHLMRRSQIRNSETISSICNIIYIPVKTQTIIHFFIDESDF